MEPAGDSPEPRAKKALPPARSPLVPPPSGKRVRSSPVVLPPTEGKPKLLPMEAPQPRRRFNRAGVILAMLIGVGSIPFTYNFQKNRVLGKRSDTLPKTDYDVAPEKRQWRMRGLRDTTEKQSIARFGTPIISRNFNVNDGAFAGPLVGQKHFYAKSSPDFDAKTKDAEVVWTFPQYVTIREVIWDLPDSYLTVWMREPRAEIDLGETPGDVVLPVAPDGGGDWVVIDNFRVGKDLVKTPPVRQTPGSSPTD